jgi:ribosomal protein L11 methyltransferase
MAYLRRVYAVPADQEELVAAELWEAGTVGLVTADEPDGRVRVEAWFAAGAGPAAAGADPLEHRLAGRVEVLAVEHVGEEDWLAVYRERARPFALGEGFWIDPREPEGEVTPSPGRRLLRLPARTAFGTGSHESTRLAVELLEEVPPRGQRVLDVGTGTGVLSFVAERLGAVAVVALDVDAGAVVQARSNARLNRASPRLFTGTIEALGPAVRFDLALLNIVPEIIVPELPDVAPLLGSGAAGGAMILSGILAERGDEVLAAAGALGFGLREARRAGEWVAFRVGREGA